MWCINDFVAAGKSSLVARQAHNLEAVGSNPAPAINFEKGGYYVYLVKEVSFESQEEKTTEPKSWV